MSFDVSVYLPEHISLIKHVPKEPDDVDQWIESCTKLRLHGAPLGSGSIIYDYWSTIGQRLRLPLIASIYNEGLEITHFETEQLETEVEQLEQYWREHFLENVEKYGRTQAEIKRDLFERIGDLKEAIRIVKERKAVLIIS